VHENAVSLTSSRSGDRYDSIENALAVREAQAHSTLRFFQIKNEPDRERIDALEAKRRTSLHLENAPP